MIRFLLRFIGLVCLAAGFILGVLGIFFLLLGRKKKPLIGYARP
jgi:hypothetical protein